MAVLLLGVSVIILIKHFIDEQPSLTLEEQWAMEEDNAARERFISLSRVEYARWEIVNARALSTKLIDDQHDGISRQSWALTMLLMDPFSESERNLVELFSEARGLPGRLYALFLIHERAPAIFGEMKGRMISEIDNHVIYLDHDLLSSQPAHVIVGHIEDGTFANRHVLNFHDLLTNWRCWRQTTSVNIEYENWHLRRWYRGRESPPETILDGLPPRVSELREQGVSPSQIRRWTARERRK